jgi:hypothetical protein
VGEHFSIRTTDPSFLEVLRRSIGRFLTGRPESDWYLFSADARPDRRLGGTSIRGKHSLYTSGLLVYTGLSLDEMAGRLIRIIRDRLTGNAHEYVHISGAAVALEGGALLLPSAPNEHLPLLAALLVRAGAAYLGDEVVRLDPVLRLVHPLPLPLLLDTDDIALVPELGREPVPRLRSMDPPQAPMTNRRPVNLEELGGEAAPPTPIQWIVFPTFEPGAETRLLPMTKAEATFHLGGTAMLNRDIWRERALFLARDLSATTTVARLVVGSPARAVELLGESFRLPVGAPG